MARRRRTSLIENLIEIASRLPWWVSLLIALGSWLILHPIANIQPEFPKDLHQMGQSVAGQLMRTFAFFGQFVLPVVFVIGAIGSVLVRAEHKKLHANVVNAREPDKPLKALAGASSSCWWARPSAARGAPLSKRAAAGRTAALISCCT